MLRRDSTKESMTERFSSVFLANQDSDNVSVDGIRAATPYSGKVDARPSMDTSCKQLSQESMRLEHYEEITKKAEEKKTTSYTTMLTAAAAICFGLATGIISAVLIRNLQGIGVHNPFLKSSIIPKVPTKLGKRYFIKKLPKSFSIFAPNRALHSTKDIPVFFDMPGSESSFILSALVKCFNLQERKHFISTNSLCAFSKQYNKGNKARIFTLIRNPATRSVMSFHEKQNMRSAHFDERTLGLFFTDYISSSLIESDYLVRSVLCKRNDILTEDDYNTAKYFFEHYTTFGVYHDYKKSFRKFVETFGWASNEEIEHKQKCVEESFLQSSAYVGDNSNLDEDLKQNFESLRSANEYDMKLYSYILSSSEN